jgi:broad specificity phosphatase PhoE
MSVEIFIARHGQNEDNVNGILSGHRDLPLTDLGREQAQELGREIKEANLRFDTIYSSPLSRAHETAQIVSKIAHLPPPQILPELIEQDFGVMTGQLIVDIEKLCAPDILKTNTVTYFLKPDGAENFDDLTERGRQILKKVRTKHMAGKVLLVCHGNVGKMIYAAATRKPWRDVLLGFHFGNCDLIDISSDEAHKIKLKQYNH